MPTPSDTTTTTPAHVRTSVFGLPYAAPGNDTTGYFVTCPVCGFICRAEGSIGKATAEDDATKGALRTYQFHFAQRSDG
jgi:hypothetical protein